MALEVAGGHEALRGSTAQVFAERPGTVAERFGRWVADQQAARSLAHSVIRGVRAPRAARGPEPLQVAGRPMAELPRMAVEQAGEG